MDTINNLDDFFDYIRKVFKDFESIKISEDVYNLIIDVKDFSNIKELNFSNKYLNPVKEMTRLGLFFLEYGGLTFQEIIINYNSNFSDIKKMKILYNYKVISIFYIRQLNIN